MPDYNCSIFIQIVYYASIKYVQPLDVEKEVQNLYHYHCTTCSNKSEQIYLAPFKSQLARLLTYLAIHAQYTQTKSIRLRYSMIRFNSHGVDPYHRRSRPVK